MFNQNRILSELWYKITHLHVLWKRSPLSKNMQMCYLIIHVIFSCLRIVVSNTYCAVFLLCLSSSRVLCTLRCQFLWIVHFLFPLRHSLTFISIYSGHLSILLWHVFYLYNILSIKPKYCLKFISQTLHLATLTSISDVAYVFRCTSYVFWQILLIWHMCHTFEPTNRFTSNNSWPRSNIM
jgi:hypothetical protein